MERIVAAVSLTDPTLRGVRPEVISILGIETVEQIEGRVSQLEEISSVSRAENPFAVKRPDEIDLSFLSAELQFCVRSFNPKTEADRQKVRQLAGRGELFTGYFELIKLLNPKSEIVKSIIRRSLGADKTLRAIKGPLAQLETEAETQTVDASLVLRPADLLREVSEGLPSAETMKVLNATVSFLEHFALAQSKKYHSIKKKRYFKPLKSYPLAAAVDALRPGERKVFELISGLYMREGKYAQQARDLGAADFERVRDVARSQQKRHGEELLSNLVRAKASLRAAEGLTEDELSELASAESYLSEKAQQVESLLKEVDQSAINEPQIRNFLGQLRQAVVSEAQKRASDQRLAGFNRLITEANDVLVGGQRLKPTKAVPHPAQIAEGLEKFFKDEEEKPIIERGLIVAMLTGRFDSFVDTVQGVKSGDRNEAIIAIEKQRPHIFQALRDLEIESHMVRLDELLINYADQLPSFLTDKQIDSVKRALDKYFGRQIEEKPQEPIPNGPGTIEQFFTPGDLIGELNWTVLPYGEEGEQALEAEAREIVEAARKRAEAGTNIQLDLSRLEILRNVRRRWGADRCHYARGTLKDRGKVNVGGQERPDEYIVLVLQQLDDQGNITLEHAIAESPIAEINALYVFRADTEISKDFSWRQVFSVSKQDAREIGGARPLHHTKGDGRPVVEVLTDRVETLLRCNPEEFYVIRFKQGGYWLRRAIGQIASHPAS